MSSTLVYYKEKGVLKVLKADGTYTHKQIKESLKENNTVIDDNRFMIVNVK